MMERSGLAGEGDGAVYARKQPRTAKSERMHDFSTSSVRDEQCESHRIMYSAEVGGALKKGLGQQRGTGDSLAAMPDITV